MHESVMYYVRRQVEQLGLADHKTLEVGSRDINGTPRQFFTGSYIGIDMIDGPSVDKVAVANKLPFKARSFDVVVCTEMLEHDPQPWETFPEMARVLKKGGYLILTTRGIGFELHGYPDDYWRFTASAMERLSELAGLDVESVEVDPQCPGVFLTARKP